MGFTLLETLLAILILGIIFQIFSFSTGFTKIPLQTQVNSQNWQILVNELESAKHRFRFQRGSATYAYLESLEENKVYKLAKYQDQLRFSPGYMPLITNVRAVDFNYNEPFLKLTIKFNNEEVKTDEVYIPKK